MAGTREAGGRRPALCGPVWACPAMSLRPGYGIQVRATVVGAPRTDVHFNASPGLTEFVRLENLPRQGAFLATDRMPIQNSHHVFRSLRCELLRVVLGSFGQSDKPYRINDRKSLVHVARPCRQPREFGRRNRTRIRIENNIDVMGGHVRRTVTGERCLCAAQRERGGGQEFSRRRQHTPQYCRRCGLPSQDLTGPKAREMA